MRIAAIERALFFKAYEYQQTRVSTLPTKKCRIGLFKVGLLSTLDQRWRVVRSRVALCSIKDHKYVCMSVCMHACMYVCIYCCVCWKI